MKRDSSYNNTIINTWDLQKNFSSCSSSSSKPINNKMWFPASSPPQEVDDEIFAVLGYNLKSSDIFDVAQKFQNLDQVIEQDADVSHLASETVHYNPSDLSSVFDTMITGLNPDFTPTFDPTNSIFDFGSDLTAIPGEAIYPPSKKTKTSPYLPQDSIKNPTRPVVLIDSQENGIRLVHTLMACAEAVQQENFAVAEALLKNIGFLAVSQAGAMRKVATYFAEALARRIYKLYPTPNPQDSAFTDLLQMNFYETCPYLKFAHFTANQAILEAFEGKSHVHVIDFSMNQGIQWPALLQALALRPGGPPVFRLTGVGPPSHDNKDHLQEIGWKLAQIAESINVEFEYKGFVANSLADLDSSMFDVREGETVAINSIFELHRLLSRVGAIEKVLGLIKDLKPEILTMVEQEANHNGNNFLTRFTESLHYYSTLFDSLESGGGGVVSEEDKLMSEVYLGQQICNVVACDGVDRVERHESLDRWRIRLGESGFKPVHLGSNAFKQASMLLALFAGGDGYRVEENNGCLMLGWHTRPLIATSAWKMS